MTPDPKSETPTFAMALSEALRMEIAAAGGNGYCTYAAAVSAIHDCVNRAIAATTPSPLTAGDLVKWMKSEPPADPDAAAREVLCREMPVGATFKYGGASSEIIGKGDGYISYRRKEFRSPFVCTVAEFRGTFNDSLTTDIRLPAASAPSAPAPQPAESGAGDAEGEVVRVWEWAKGHNNHGDINVEIKGMDPEDTCYRKSAGTWHKPGVSVVRCEVSAIPITDPARVAEVKASYAAWRAGQTAKPLPVCDVCGEKLIGNACEGSRHMRCNAAPSEATGPKACPFCGAVPEWDGEVVSCPTTACLSEGLHIERWNRRAPSPEVAAELLRVNTENARLAKEVERVTRERDEAKAVLDKPTTMVEHETVGYRAAVRLLNEARAESADLRVKLAEAEKQFAQEFNAVREERDAASADRDRHARGEAELLTLLTDIRNTNSYWKRELDDDVCERIADAIAVLPADPAAPSEATGVEGGVAVFEDKRRKEITALRGSDVYVFFSNPNRWILQTISAEDVADYLDQFPGEILLAPNAAAKLLAADPLPPAAVPAEVLTESALPAPRGDGAGGGK